MATPQGKASLELTTRQAGAIQTLTRNTVPQYPNKKSRTGPATAKRDSPAIAIPPQ